MLFWLNKKTEKNNIVILSKKSILLGSCGSKACGKVEALLKKNIHPLKFMGKQNLLAIPFDRIQTINYQNKIPGIELGVKTKAGLKKIMLAFSDIESSKKCYLYLKKLTPQALQKTETRADDEQQRIREKLKKQLRQPHKTELGIVPSAPPVSQWLSEPDESENKQTDSSKSVTKLQVFKKQWFSKKKVAIALALAAVLLGTWLMLSAGPEALYEAIQSKQISSSEVDHYLEAGADINYRGKDGVTPLLSAINQKKDKLVVTLVKKGADLSLDYNGETALDLAIANGLNRAAKTMLEKKAPSSHPKSLLTRAIQNKLGIDTLSKLVAQGADVNYVNENGSSVLATALLFGSQYSTVRLLLENGASTRIKVNGVPPAMFARTRNRPRLAMLLSKNM